jgi:acylphosphatase
LVGTESSKEGNANLNHVFRAPLSGLKRTVPKDRLRAAMADVHHESIFFTGRVQGVGFRYTALQVAKEFEVSGYVRNLSDGRVQLEVEGDAVEVKRYVEAIEERMHGYVRSIERTADSRSASFAGFGIK